MVGGQELVKWPSDLEATVMHSDNEVARGRRQSLEWSGRQ